MKNDCTKLASEDTAVSPTLTVGRTLGKWHIVGFLGRGGMAEVYEVEDISLGARYALKLFTYARGEEASARARFFAEGRLLAQLDHPRLVRVYDLGEDAESGRPYFVMDLVLDPKGQPHTLADADVAGVDEDQVAIWYEDLREGLEYIHDKGILHRDLKLQNVLIGPDGHAVLSDFGVAKIFNPSLREKVGLTAEQTLIAVKGGQKTIMGSVGYMAPEIEMGVAASKESDLYALGVIVFKLLTGVWCDSRTDVVGDLETYNPVWRQILPKLLHANPAGRECPSWRELEKAWREDESYKAEQALDELRAKRHEAVRGRRNGWVAAVCVTLVAAVLGWFMQHMVVIPPPTLSPATLPPTTLPPAPPPLDFDAVVRIPANAPEEEPGDEDGMPSHNQFMLARVDAWVLTHDIFADLTNGKITRDKAVRDLRRLVRIAQEDEMTLFDSQAIGFDDYVQQGEAKPLVYLLQSSISNLTAGAVKNK